jgi:hypothetical protein
MAGTSPAIAQLQCQNDFLSLLKLSTQAHHVYLPNCDLNGRFVATNKAESL